MGGGDHCSVGGCNNDRRYPEKNVKRSHVDVLQFHSIPANEAMRNKWEEQLSHGREGFKMGKNMKVCSNHFQDAKPTFANSYPTLFLNESGKSKKSPVKRRTINKISGPLSSKKSKTTSTAARGGNHNGASHGSTEEREMTVSVQSFSFPQLTRESDVRLHTGLPGKDVFRLLFSTLLYICKLIAYICVLVLTTGLH